MFNLKGVKMNKQFLKPALFLSVGVILGVFLVSSFDSSMLNSLFASEKNKIGAESAPVTMNSQMKIINDSFVAVSDAVLPTVVSINVESEMKGGSMNSPRGLDEFFKYFGGPNGNGGNEEDDGENKPQKNERKPRQRGAGSGVIISKDGYIVTNNHVVENAVEDGIKVITSDKKEYTAKLIGTDPSTDLAVLKIEADNLQQAHFGDINTVRVGEFAIAVGNPLGLNSTVTSGIVSAIGRGRLGLPKKAEFSVEYYIQTDAAINPGNSGGGLFDLNGSLIGINTAIATETGTYIGYGFAIPVDLAKSVILDLIDDGKVDRGFIGVKITSIKDEVEAKSLGLDSPKGAWIQEVMPKSAAKEAGIENGDVILKVDGKAIRTSEELQSQIVLHRAGDKVKLSIWRDGKEIEKIVKLKSNNKEDDKASNEALTGGEPNDNKKEDPVKFEDFGFSVKPLDSKTKEDFDVANGVLITEVKQYSPVFERGLVRGGVIFKADRKEIRSIKELKDILNSKKVGEAILLHIKYKDNIRMIAIEVPKKQG
jgi:serine protease Do